MKFDSAEKTSFKQLARQAKKRMKNGYWDTENKNRKFIIEENSQKGKSVERINELYTKRLERELYFAKNKGDPDAELYQKVCKILDENEYILNPIKYLIDHKNYDALDAISKQNYILKLADKYNKLKERYMEERELRKKII